MIEIVRRGASAERARVALFDFDGTISLIRSGWMDVMVPMMVEILAETKSGETEKQLTDRRRVCRPPHRQADDVPDDRAGGEVEKRGGTPLEPLAVQAACTSTCCGNASSTASRSSAEGSASPEKYLVPGSRALLERLEARGFKMYLRQRHRRRVHGARGAAARRHALFRRPASTARSTTTRASRRPF